MELARIFDSALDDHARILAACRLTLRAPFLRLVETCASALRGGGKILFFGNGGSASDAQHLATELCVRFQRDRRALPGLALTSDGAALTAIGNDLGFDELFARQIEALARPGDVALGISTSGCSENVIRGLCAAGKCEAVAAGLAGGDGGRMAGLADPLLVVPSRDTARVQELHITLGHALCAAVERELGLA